MEPVSTPAGIVTVLPPNRILSRLLGAGRGADGPLVWSSFLLRQPTDEGLLLFNTLTLRLIHVSRDLVPALEAPAGALRDWLRRKWFLVPPGMDEHQTVRELRQTLRLMNPPADWIRKFTILTTTACNARCAYCFEQGWTPVTMTPETADRVTGFILRRSGGHRIRIDWFGGEPLLNRRAMDRISARLRDAGADYNACMTTNGYLFARQTLAEDLRLWRLLECQITLDGREQAYNRIKNYVYPGVNAYARVIDNIHALADAGVQVRLRLNFDRSNLEEIRLLAEELGREFGGHPAISAYANILYEFEDEGAPRSGAERAALEQARRELLELLEQSGLWQPAPLIREPRWHMCMADSGDMLTVLPDGRLGLCEQYVREHLIGSIDRPETDAAEEAEFRALRPEIPECADCPLYPDCIRLRRCRNQLCHRQRREGWEAQRRRSMQAEWERFRSRQAKPEAGRADGADDHQTD